MQKSWKRRTPCAANSIRMERGPMPLSFTAKSVPVGLTGGSMVISCWAISTVKAERSRIGLPKSEPSDWPAKSSIRGARIRRVLPLNPAVSADTTSRFCARFASSGPRWRRGSSMLTARRRRSRNRRFRAHREIAPSVTTSTFLPLAQPFRKYGPRRWRSARSEQRLRAPDMRSLPAPSTACGCCGIARTGLFSERLTACSS